jgi:hypothetical protein
MKIFGPIVMLVLFLGIAYLCGRREPQEFVAATSGMLVGMLAAVYFWWPSKADRS